ncbi:hypothetical protein JIN85_14500 [Luteolibacter pohnpeiensis]|uniref:ABC transporter permease n=1 Tax=Luteolibacter pohnpeiensis TaxID=454153 RepID=A0A934S5U0_9BACT|nr:hypothetical protein [Luteolibacter pohnpeiensis]MBK1883630.1 hypothetical protein [Luteolibacter pohnpeiensis]
MTSNDFPDRLPPMLVKELRQGMRTISFLGVFMALQIILCLILLSATLGSTTGDSIGNVISITIFTILSIAVLILQPLRGINAISSEVKSNTLEIMSLTRLSATRIVYGKWVAIVSQTALLMSTIIPYLILRYFFGGMNLFGELSLVLIIFATSAALTAATVGISATSSVILRNILPILFAIMAVIALFQFLSFSIAGPGMSLFYVFDSGEYLIPIISYLAAITYIGWSCLKAGSLIIAPSADNLSTSHRLIVIGLSVVALGLSTLDQFNVEMIPIMFAVIMGPAIAIALSESSIVIAPVREALQKKRYVGRLGSSFLLPGWQSGIVFTIVISAIALAAIFIRPSPLYLLDRELNATLMIIVSALFPAVICNLPRNTETNRFDKYLLYSLATTILGIVILALAAASGDNIKWVFIWNPVVLMSEMDKSSEAGIIVAWIGIYLFILFLLAIRNAKQHRLITEQVNTTPEV